MDYYPAGYANYQQNGNAAGYYNNQNQNYDNAIYYVGPYCKDASLIYLGTFLDNECTYTATHATFTSKYKTNNGESFPYFDTPIVASEECISCQDEDEELEMENNANAQQGNNANNNNAYQYMQRYYYNNGQDQQQQQQEEQQNAQTNELCGYIEEGDEDIVISCVYQNGGNGNGNGNYEKNYAGCSYLDMLPKLDGRYKNSVADISNKLKLQDSYTVVLAVLAVIMVMTICVITMCNPSSIPDRNARLIDMDEVPSQLNAMPRTGSDLQPALTSVGVEAIVD